jgi:hypothetical protein
MERKEINSSIKLDTIKNRLERINKTTKQYKYEIIKVKKNIFNYEIAGKTKHGAIVFQKSFIDKIDVINFLDGIDFQKSIVEYKY